MEWFQTYGRVFPWRSGRQDVYSMVLSEILLQRTTATAVAAFVPGFLGRYPSWQSLASGPLGDIEEALKPIGLWRRRAATLQRLAEAVIGMRGQVPCDRPSLENLPGVGQYICSAVLLLVYGQRQPLLDTNMARVLERFFGPRQLADIRYDPYLQQLARSVVDCTETVHVNWAIMDLAAGICRIRTPLCQQCPLQERCLYATAVSPLERQ